MLNNSNFNTNKYLKSIIPHLDEFSFLCGTEGKVYFIDDKFVVKTYFEPFVKLDVFDSFCKEIKGFSEKGYSVPQIYAWESVFSEDKSKFCAYILEERVKGKVLFNLDNSSLYEACKSFCTKEEFDLALADRKNNPELAGLISKEHILEFLETNRALNALSDSEVEKFISSIYGLAMDSRFSFPDVQATNVMFDKNKLTIIDNAYLGHAISWCKEDYVKTLVLRDMFLLFLYNEHVNWMPKFKCANSSELESLKKANREECFLAMRRFVRKTNEMYNPQITDSYDYDACKNVAYEVFDNKQADEICSEIYRGF